MSTLLTFIADASSSIVGGATSACGSSCNTSTSVNSLFSSVTNILIFLVGSISVIMIIVGGLRYVTSGGDSKAVSAAKDTILYSIVGIVVSAAAYAIVTFVATKIH